MPALEFGTEEIKCIETCIRDAVKNAIEIGHRLFDTRPTYETERLVREAIEEKIAADVVKPQDLFVVNKMRSTEHIFEQVVPACRKSLEELGLSHSDLYLIIGPKNYKDEADSPRVFCSQDRVLGEMDYTEIRRSMEECVRLGLTRSIDLSNSNVNQMFRIIDHAKIKPVIGQDGCHLMLSQRRLLMFCRWNGFSVMCHAPLGDPGCLDSISSSRVEKSRTILQPKSSPKRIEEQNVPWPSDFWWIIMLFQYQKQLLSTISATIWISAILNLLLQRTNHFMISTACVVFAHTICTGFAHNIRSTGATTTNFKHESTTRRFIA